MAALAQYGPDFKPIVGSDEVSLDEKGRILISRKKRERLGETFVLAVGANNCLVAYPEAVWNTMVNEILSYDSINEGVDQYTRLMLGSAEDDIKFDSQGRFVIPQKMREVAQLTNKVMLVGCGNRMEIWAKSEFEEYSKYPEAYGQEKRQIIAKAYRQMKGLEI